MSLVGKEWGLSIDTGSEKGAEPAMVVAVCQLPFARSDGGCSTTDVGCAGGAGCSRVGSKQRAGGGRQQLGGGGVAVLKAAGVTVARVNTSLNLA